MNNQLVGSISKEEMFSFFYWSCCSKENRGLIAFILKNFAPATLTWFAKISLAQNFKRNNHLIMFILLINIQAASEEFFRAGEVSWNDGTLINI